MKLIKKIIVAIIFTALLFNAYAESFVYITDEVEIPFRSENSINNNNIIRTLPSGLKLSVLQTTENGWTKVKYQDSVGWMVSRYLSTKPSARKELERINEENNNNKLILKKLQSEKRNLEFKISKIKKENENLNINNSKIILENKHMEGVYKNSLEIEHDRSELTKTVLQLTEELKISRNNYQIANDRVARNWFIAGALILFLGIIIGLIMQMMIRKKRY